MKPLFYCAIIFFVINLPALAQDSGRIVAIHYPPITEREGKGMQLPKPPSGHPRLFFTNQYIPILAEKTESPITYLLWSKILENNKLQTDGILDKKATDNYNLKIRDAIEAKALIYALSKKEEYGRDAINILFNFYNTLNLDPKKPDIIRSVGRVITTGAIVYDWCYDLLNATQKVKLIGYMETLASTMEIKWPFLVQGSVVSHAVEAQMARDMLACGVATYDENPEIYNRVAGRIFTEFVPVRKYFYPAAYHHQGSAYGPYRFMWDMFTTFIFDRMGYPDIYGTDQAKVPYIWLYTRRPDGQLFRNGDDFGDNYFNFGMYFNYTWASDAYAGSYFKDPVLMAQAYKEGQLGKSNDEFIFDFLFYDVKVPIDSNKNKLPLSRYFEEPFGTMVARTGWSDGMSNNEVVAQMKIGGRNFGNHAHLDAGNFQVYCNGPLTVNSGVYQGKNGTYGGEHFKNYYQRTIAHNSLLIYDSSEVYKFYGDKLVNDGGQRYSNDAREPANMQELMQDTYRTGEVLAHYIGPDSVKPVYSYLKGDIASAYTAKVKSAKRSFLFINCMDKKTPAVLLVYDVVTAADKNFKKTWLLHSVEEPLIAGNEVIIQRTERGYNGRLVNTTVYPPIENMELKKIGGAKNAFSVAGKNYPQEPYNPDYNAFDGAAWRIELSPRHPANTDYFLNLMQVSAAAGPKKTFPVNRMETPEFMGVSFSDQLVLFGKSGEINGGSFEITLPGKPQLHVFIADIQDGDWNIAEVNNPQMIIKKKSEHQVLHFQLKGGTYRISKVLN